MISSEPKKVRNCKTRLGRPAKEFPAELIARILRQAEIGMPQRLIAQGIGVTEGCFSKWLATKEEFRRVFQSARIRGVEAKIAGIEKSISGGKDGYHDWKADAWILSRMFPEEFADPGRKIEVNNTAVTNVTVVSAEKLKEIQERRRTALAAHGRN